MAKNGMTQNCSNNNRFMVYVFDDIISIVDYTSESRLLEYERIFDERYNTYYMDDITKDEFKFRVVIGVDESTAIDKMVKVVESEIHNWFFDNEPHISMQVIPAAFIAAKICVFGFGVKLGIL